MLFSKEDLQNKMVESIHPFKLVAREDEPTGHRSQRMTVYTFEYAGLLYQFDLAYDEMEGQHWYEVGEQEDLPEVEAHTTTTTVYRLKK